jgi:UDP-N-acetylmuramoyl-tripeptide--D-alanyl-D-alanine ligase
VVASNVRDGHEFISVAKSAGAAAILISKSVSKDIQESIPHLDVDNTLDGLWALGRAGRQRTKGKIIGITGSSGKTTARSWLEVMLTEQGSTHASIGSLNNHWGVPLSLARMPEDSAYGIFEIGMNNPGEIAPLAKLVNPDVAIILNVLPAHLGSFADLDGIRREKLSISLGLRPGGTLILHEDIRYKDLLCEGLPRKNFSGEKKGLGEVTEDNIIDFGLSSTAKIAGQAHYNEEGAQVKVTIEGRDYHYCIPAGGEHRVLTSLACLAAVYAIDADIAQACAVIPQLKAPGGRGNLIELGQCLIIDDSYNANPISMRYALESLARTKGGRKIALLGEMLELGSNGDQLHQQVLEACHSLDGVITFGHGFANAADTLGPVHWAHYNSAAELDLVEFASGLEEGDTILVKGSNKVFWLNHFVKSLQAAIA